MLSLVAGLQYPSGKYFPLAGTTFYVLKENLDAALARGGVQPPPGVSPLRAWLMACEAKQDAVCAQGNRVFVASTVATLRTDLQGQAELGTLSAGTYYVLRGQPALPAAERAMERARRYAGRRQQFGQA